MDDALDALIEFGKLLLKVELSKKDSDKIIPLGQGNIDEQVLFQKIGKFWNQQNKRDRPDGLFVVTTHRIVFLAKIKTMFTKTDFLSFPFEYVENIEKTKIWLVTPAIKFTTTNLPFIFTFLNSENVDEIIQTVGSRKKDNRNPII